MTAFLAIVGGTLLIALVFAWVGSMSSGVAYTREVCNIVRASGIAVDERDPIVVRFCVMAKRQGYTPRDAAAGVREMLRPTQLSEDLRKLTGM